jgi:hypothetical protein
VVNKAGNTGISFQTIAGGFKGKYKSHTAQEVRFRLEQREAGSWTFYIDGVPVKPVSRPDGFVLVPFKAGEHDWQWSVTGLIPGIPQITGTVNSRGGCTVQWTKLPGATAYQLQLSIDNGIDWLSVNKEVMNTTATVQNLINDTKVHFRVMAKAAGGWGETSAPYPVYVTAKAPHCPEGLLLVKSDTGLIITWGQVLGTSHYKLYRRIKANNDTTWQLVYSGKDRAFKERHAQTALLYEYVVTAVNDNGESNKSTSRDTDPAGFMNWYPQPRNGFRRDTENHENGFPEFNPFIEDTMRVISYPLK